MNKKEMIFYRGKLINTMSKEELRVALLEAIKLSLEQGKKLNTTFIEELKYENKIKGE